MDDLILLGEKVIYMGAFIALSANLIKLGKAIGSIEELLEVHTTQIENLQDKKRSKEECEAYRDHD